MRKKTRRRLNIALHNLRQANDMLEGISLRDGLVFNDTVTSYRAIQQAIDTLKKHVKKPDTPQE